VLSGKEFFFRLTVILFLTTKLSLGATESNVFFNVRKSLNDNLSFHGDRSINFRGEKSLQKMRGGSFKVDEEVPIGRVRSRLMDSSKNKASKSMQKTSDAHVEMDKSNLVRGDPLNVLFLSSDTGGGHRASAEALGKQFQLHYPGTNFFLYDPWKLDGHTIFKYAVESYKHLSSHPRQWRLFYHFGNMRPMMFVINTLSRFSGRRISRRIESYNPDVVISVHPTMNYVPMKSTRKLSKKKSKYIPFYTVVTDFGSGHSHWFQYGVDKHFVASEKIMRLGKRRGGLKDKDFIMRGLPIRNDFAVHAKAMGDKRSRQGLAYQKKIRKELKLKLDQKMVLVVGGGEGVGSLSNIVDALYVTLAKRGIDVTLAVVCGRNEKLRKELQSKDWDRVLEKVKKSKMKKFLDFVSFGKRNKKTDSVPQKDTVGKVEVKALGFVSNMASYMVASDVLVSKAGPGTIAEAASLGLPIMLTSFLPGQEAGNVELVLDGGFGDFCEDYVGIAEEVGCWLQDDDLLNIMSQAASKVGMPNAASYIATDIGQSTHQLQRS